MRLVLRGSRNAVPLPTKSVVHGRHLDCVYTQCVALVASSKDELKTLNVHLRYCNFALFGRKIKINRGAVGMLRTLTDPVYAL